MTRVFLLPTLILLLLGALCFIATSPRARTGAAPLTFASADDIKTLDPGKMSWMNDIRAAMGLWEGLAAYDPTTLAPIPGTAESWTISPDGLTYTFHIRPTARWSNGDPVTAQDFIFAWRRVLTPATAGDYVTMLFHIAGAEDYYNALDKKQPTDFATVGVTTPDPHTLIVRLRHPCTYFLDLAAFPPLYPLHERAMAPFLLKAADPARGYDPRWTRPPHLITNGPFQLTEWRFKQYLALRPNEHYWDRAAVQCPLVLLKAYNDSRAALLAYQSRDVDVLSWVPQDLGPDLLSAHAAGNYPDLKWRPVFGTYYYIFNCTKKPFNDPRVRRALALAIDKQQLVDHVTRMGQQPIATLVPPSSIPGYISPAGLALNIPEAKRLLAAAGYPDGAGLGPIELLYNTESTHDRVAQAIGQMWQSNLGVQVTFRGEERATFGSDRRSHNFVLARGGWYGDYTDPVTWLDLARTGDGNNDGQYSNPAFDALLRQAEAEPDAAKRFALLKQAEAILVEQDFPFIPLYQYSDGFIYDEKKIAGCDLNVRLLTQFKYMHRR